MAVEKSAAVLTIKDAALMTKRGAADIAKWLRRQADMMDDAEARGTLADRYRARYIYKEK